MNDKDDIRYEAYVARYEFYEEVEDHDRRFKRICEDEEMSLRQKMDMLYNEFDYDADQILIALIGLKDFSSN